MWDVVGCLTITWRSHWGVFHPQENRFRHGHINRHITYIYIYIEILHTYVYVYISICMYVCVYIYMCITPVLLSGILGVFHLFGWLLYSENLQNLHGKR